MEIIEKNIFILAIFFWILIATFIKKNLDINKNKIVYLGLIIPITNFLYNHFQNKKVNHDKDYRDQVYMRWFFDRIHTNSIAIATAVFALGLLTEPRMGTEFIKIIPLYILTIFFGVGLNLSMLFIVTKKQEIFIAKLKSIFLSYGIGTMMIGMLYTFSFFYLKKK